MSELQILFPNQLFKTKYLDKSTPVVLVEHKRFFTDFKFHKKKLIFHKASCLAYKEELEKAGFKVRYLPFEELEDDWLAAIVDSRKNYSFEFFEPVDEILKKDINKQVKKLHSELRFKKTPVFLNDENYLRDYFSGEEHFSMQSFYIEQRKRLKILVKDDHPVSGKWSLDKENRKKLPKDIEIPEIYKPQDNDHVRQAVEFVKKNFADNPGTIENFFFPVKRSDAGRWLNDFLENRLERFGPYEDAISRTEPFVFHSLLSMLINAGLLTPREVVDKTMRHNSKNKIPDNSLEGFIRQVIGWREFMRAVYVLKGEDMRKANFWGCKNKLTEPFYDGTTGIDPVDRVIGRLNQNAYLHHIERLMIIGNFMLLCHIRPEDVYRWFMELFIDAYDWVMVSNVYGMSQDSDGGSITTKPYISSSNYVLKMSDYSKGPWCDIWDGLYWRFVHVHKDFFNSNPRMKMMTSYLDKMGKSKLDGHLKTAEDFLDKIF